MATAQAMKDTELRGLILQAFYDRRQAESIESPSAGWIDGKTSNEEVFRICKQLGDHGLIKWYPTMEGGAGIISAHGVDVVEGERQSEIALQLVHHYTTNVSNSSNVIVGNNNTQSVENAFEDLLFAIGSSSGDNTSKTQAKSLLSQLANSPVFAQIVGAASKFGLDKFN